LIIGLFFYNIAQRFGAWRRSGFRSTKLSNGVYGAANGQSHYCRLFALQKYNKKMEIENNFQKKEKIISGLFLSVLWLGMSKRFLA